MAENNTHEKNERPAIPQFTSREEEADFWDTHDMSNYWSELEPVELKVAENLALNPPDERMMWRRN